MGNLLSTDKVVTENDLKDFYDGIRPFLNGSYPTLASPFALSELYSTSEKLIGQWTDGKPLYMKCFSATTPPSAGWADIIKAGLSNVDNVIELRGTCNDSGFYEEIPITWSKIGSATQIDNSIALGYNKSTDYIGATVTTNFVNVPCIVIIKYTKTTDSATQNFSTPSNYSTSETVVGTWIDGKPLYQKTKMYPAGTLPDTTWSETGAWTATYMNDPISNVDKVINVSGFWQNLGNYFGDINWHQNTYDISVFYSKSTTDAQNGIVFSTRGSWSGVTVWVTIQYTKTTD